MYKFKVGDHVRIIKDGSATLNNVRLGYSSKVGYTGIITAIYSGAPNDTRLPGFNLKQEPEYDVKYDPQFSHWAIIGKICFEDDIEIIVTKNPFKAYEEAMKVLGV